MPENHASAPDLVRIILGVLVSASFYYLAIWLLVKSDSSLWLLLLAGIVAIYLADRILKLVLGLRHLTPTPKLKDDEPGLALRRLPVNLVPLIPVVPVLVAPASADGEVNLPVFAVLALVAAVVEILLLRLILRRG